MNTTTCPTGEKLREFSFGRMNPDDSDALLSHLEHCASCQVDVDTITDVEDSLIADLRMADDHAHIDRETGCQNAMAKALGALAIAKDGDAFSDFDFPRMIGDYEIVRPLGRGGMGNVFLARQTKLGREAALKLLANHRLADPRMKERFESEMRAIGRLSHPNIVTAHDAREIDGVAVLAMEFIDGFNLSQLLKRLGPLSVANACEIARQVATALAYTDSAGFVHRDIKPSNVMLNADGQVKVLDLGLARLCVDGTEHPDATATGQTVGTADYVAPEQVCDSRNVDIRADIYSLGCTLFKLLTDKALFADAEHATAFSKMNAHVSEPAPSLADARPDVPAELVRLIDGMLQKAPVDRPQTPKLIERELAKHTGSADLAQLAQEAMNAEPIGSPAPSMSFASHTPKTQPMLLRPVPVFVAIASGLLGIGAGVFLGILITIKHPDGTTTTVNAPKGSTIDITDTSIEGSISSLEERNADGGSREDERDLRVTNEELTRVTIPVEYEDGSPATGTEVTMTMAGNPDRPVVVTGKANAQGVAFNRNLPYGKYTMTIKVADGDTAYWSATLNDILVEFGGSYEQKIIAPTPVERATVELSTGFTPTGLKGLRFGAYRDKQEGFSGMVWSPEPNKQDDRLAHFPVLGDGISTVAVMMSMSVTRDVRQPGGETLDWQWMRREHHYSEELLLTDDSVIELNFDSGANAAFGVVFDLQKSAYFSNMPEEHGIQYFTLFDQEFADDSISLEFPSGNLEYGARSLFGKANEDVIQALGLKPQAGCEVWLEATLNAQSAWVPRIVDLSDWSHGKGSKFLAYKTLSLKPGETEAIRVASPATSTMDD